MVIRPATRDTALLIAEPIPDCFSLIEPRIADVNGATVTAKPRPNTAIPGSSCVQ